MWSILVQNTRSLEYLMETDHWSYHADQARNFGRIHLAAKYCTQLKLEEVHIVVVRARPDGSFDPTLKTIIRLPRHRTAHHRGVEPGRSATAA